MHVDLHWLDVTERVDYKLVSMVHNRLHLEAPQYLMDAVFPIPISDVASRRHLRSASRHHLVVPRHNLSTYGRRTFAVAGPAAWKSLSDDLRDPAISTHSFRRLLKTRLFQSRPTSAYSSIHVIRFIYLRLTYLLFYFHIVCCCAVLP